ncbi:hypothetical protein Taro_056542 [Colocasia esculenta]|uniref:Uncharacterized protein n=1 Tax=Colocasia esculenta TaxID=4460 RepID=A0A843XTS4_COLES|nr:hypothetical protein [Colocasia esculenta]
MARRRSQCMALLAFLFILWVGDGVEAAMIHDLLRHHGLPAGLLPKTVRSFSLDESTGRLQVRLDDPCYGQWPGSRVFFDRVIAGNLSYGELSGVMGLSQEELFLWFPVRAITVSDPSSGLLQLDIGLALKQLSFSLFDDPPDCHPGEVTEEPAGVLLHGSA